MNTSDTGSTEAGKIQDFFRAWGEGLISLSAPDFVKKFYAPDSLLIPTIINKPCISLNDKIEYFERFLKLRPHLQLDERALLLIEEESALDAGLYSFHFPKQDPIHARYSFFYKKYKQQWLIVHHHSSLLPN